MKRLLITLAASTLLTACSAVDRLANIGEVPMQSPISNPVEARNYQPVTLPMPNHNHQERQANSLWGGDSRKTFFEDQRAKTIGDILTVKINIKDDADMRNESTRTRAAAENAAANAALGLQTYIPKILPGEVDPSALLDISNNSNAKGTGRIRREEEVNLKIAAIISQILPNGNMVINGRQEVRVNYENRILQVTGVIRPQDIGIDNSIAYDKVAEARISYGGKGQMSDVQQPRYGQQLIDILSPF